MLEVEPTGKRAETAMKQLRFRQIQQVAILLICHTELPLDVEGILFRCIIQQRDSGTIAAGIYRLGGLHFAQPNSSVKELKGSSSTHTDRKNCSD